MAQTYLYPSSAELSQIDKLMIDQLTLNDPIFKEFPFRTSPDPMLLWDQEDSTWGLMNARGENGEFTPIPKLGSSRYYMKPGVYGERDDISEDELTMRAAYGSFATPIDIADLVAKSHKRLTNRHINRMRNILWTLMTTGVYNVTDAKGEVIERTAFTPQQFAASTAWSNTTTATPFADFQAVQLLDLGISVKFDGDATAYMNRKTYNYMFNNTNATDLGRFRLDYGQTLVSKMEIDDVMRKNSLPRIEVVNDSYRDTALASAGVRFLADNKVVVVGNRTNNAPLGNFVYTRDVNIMGGGSSEEGGGVFVKTIDTAATNGEPPRRISVYRGFKGGPVISYPQAIVIMSV